MIRFNKKQQISLLVVILITGFVIAGMLSDDEEKALINDVNTVLEHVDQCRKEMESSSLDCLSVLTEISRVAVRTEIMHRENKSFKSRIIQLYENMARLANSLDNYEMAVQAYEKLTYYEPQTASNYGLLARSLVRAGQPRAAVRYARLAVQLQPDQWHAHRINAQVLEANNELREARDAYQRAVELAPLDEKDKLEKEIVRLEQTIMSPS